MANEKTSARRGSGEAVRVWLLGGFRVSVGVVGGSEWRGRKAERLVKLLALSESRRLHREEATALLWPNLDSKRAANNLHRALHFARKALAPADIPLRGGLLSLCPKSPLWVDVEAFEDAAKVARRTREPAAYRAAVELYSGDLLPEDRYEAWAEERRRELRASHLALLMELAALHEGREEFHPAIEALRKVVAADLSREEAHLALMRVYTLSGERERAISQFERLEAALEGLGSEPKPAARLLHENISAGRFPPARTEVHTPEEARIGAGHNLPNARTSFVGREREMVEVKRSLAMTQLLTLTGTGGCGKTRLALEVAKDLVGAYPDGVWMVKLAPVSDGTLAPRTVAGTLGLREQPGLSLTETLSNYLAPRQALLVLDNCEHVIGDAARFADALLGSCERLRILATSREALGIAGEVVWRVPTLTAPEKRDSLEHLIRCEAVRLFVDRARSKLPAFDLTEGNAQAVAEACRRLDGIPLAIELATARVAALAVEQVADRLNDSLNILALGNRTAEPRHQTMRATLQWSHDLLGEDEKALFRRLSVFAGGWTLEAAEAVGEGGGIERGEVLNLLDGLVDKSLVVAEATADGAMRYRMLEPIRQYAREKLEESGEAEKVRERHAAFLLDLAERAEPELRGPRPGVWLERLELEFGNLRSALSWAFGDGGGAGERAVTGLRMAAALGGFWGAQDPAEGRRWLEEGLAKSGAAPASVRAKALNEAGFIAAYEGDPAATALLEESLALCKELGDRLGAAYAISNLGHAMVHVGPRERLASLREEVETLLSEPSEKRVRAHLLAFLGFAAASEADFEQMEVRLEEALVLFRDLEDIWDAAVCVTSLGYISIGRDDPAGAARFEEGLRYQRELKNKTAIFMGISGMAGVAALRGQPTRSVKLMGFSEALREEIGLTFESLSKARYDYEKYLAVARAGLDEEELDATWAEGRAMSPEQAIEYALSEKDAAEGAASKSTRAKPIQEPPRTPNLLSRREREVASLIGQGFSNHQIAEELGISERTVEGHVSKVLRKLGLRSRTQIATWVIEHPP